MMKKQSDSGVTLIEVLVVIIIIGILSAISFGALNANTKLAENNWANTLGRTVQEGSCSKQDTDGDGKVTCTYTSPEGVITQGACPSTREAPCNIISQVKP